MMKIAHFRHQGRSAWGIVDIEAGEIQPVVGELTDWGPALTSGHGTPTPEGKPLQLGDVQLLPPLTATSTIVGVGMNYWSHLEKLGVTERPPSTVGFIKPRAAIIGPDEEMAYPAITKQLDFEVELVAVIGASDLSALPRPTDGVLGYTVGNDVSARDTPSPLGGFDLFSMKALDRSTPVGPWVTTKDEFGGSGQPDTEILLRVNGEERQRDRTRSMLWNVDECLEYVLARTSLGPGDLLFTGTTDGVGAEDGRYLEPGDVIEAEIERIGVLRNTVGPRP
ncbi:fumarylacetoacetate hydrolase family protein [Streptomyces phaeochromogenes]|uniref:fumarylacetoacetate hydrolase family protein n=1 Tax=Streptomyces phaeochromogenes TaxID=1923 RepID=UPI002DD7F0A5|nr:fumarylacetoacetate hydrolase family protein [Streptomyces phaeochromogenes]WRZ34497.1 fumarylacetoacetate hydrolase family protein [Streptomyces phaeochromogenes]